MTVHTHYICLSVTDKCQSWRYIWLMWTELRWAALMERLYAPRTRFFSLLITTGNNVLQSLDPISSKHILGFQSCLIPSDNRVRSDSLKSVFFCFCLACEVRVCSSDGVKGLGNNLHRERVEWERGGNLVPHAALSSYWVCLLNTQNSSSTAAGNTIITLQVYPLWLLNTGATCVYMQ